jgi:hypothetical protein
MLSSSARTSMKSTPQTKNGLAAHLVVFQDLAILAKPDVEAKAFSPMRRYGVFLHGSVHGLGRPRKQKSLPGWEAWRVGEPGGDLLSHGESALSSARRRFTVLFGMGRGGSNALWPPGNSGFALRGGRFACDRAGRCIRKKSEGLGVLRIAAAP